MIQKYKDSKVANELAEPINSAKYQIQIIPNPSIGLDDYAMDIATEQIISLSGLDAFENIPGLQEQSFGGGNKRHFSAVNVDNMISLSLQFNVNLRGDDGTEATTLVVLKKMKDKQFNRATGERGLKKDCVFTVIVRRLTKDNKVWWEGKMKHCLFDGGISGLNDVGIDNDNVAKLSVKFKSDKNEHRLVSTF